MYRSGSGGKAGEDGRKLKCLIRGDQGGKTGEDGRKLKTMAYKKGLAAVFITGLLCLVRSFDVSAAESAALSVRGGLYEVAAGDTLWGIAEKLWQDGRRYPEIFRRNRDRLTDPDLIVTGKVLVIPPEGTTDYELTWEEPLTEQVVRNALMEIYGMDAAQREAFLDRPVMASDISVIESVSYYMNNHASTTYIPEVTWKVNDYEEIFELERGQEYAVAADLANLTGVKELSVNAGVDDYAFLSAMPHLEALTLISDRRVENVDFLRGRSELRSLALSGGGFGEITDLSMLEECGELTFLYLSLTQVEDYSFLKKCPQMRTFILAGNPLSEMHREEPDLSLLENVEYVQIYGTKMHRDEDGVLHNANYATQEGREAWSQAFCVE